MCGIWAIFGIPEYSKYAACAMKISQRGPDAFRMETIPHFQNCCVAFHRLAIVGDLFGMQPMRIKALPHLCLIYNGEIYNHKEVGKQYDFDFLTKCDGEVILHLYDKFGAEKMAQMLDGVFAFCIIDTKSKEVHIGRDTFGIRPMFTLSMAGKETGILALSSEAKALVPLIKNFETSGSKTVVKQFPPGHYASYSLSPNGQTTFMQQKAYTKIGKPPVFETRVKPDSSDVMKNIRKLFSEAVRKRLMAERRIGCLLSGGLDSSLVASYLTKVAKENGIDYPIQTFSIGMEGSVDVAAARKVAKHIGSEHHEVIFTAEEGIQALRDVIYTVETWDTITIRGSVAHYLLSKYISKNTDTVVIYSGEGSDELCQGYSSFFSAPSPEEADEESRRLLEDLYLYDVRRCDHATAAHGLEIRVPFLDVHFTSYFLSLPPEIRQPKDGITKWLVRVSFDNTDALPKEILWRPKKGFSDGVSSSKPGQAWYEHLQNHIKNQVPDETLASAADLYPNNTPKTKEGFYYRQIFEEFFPGQGHFRPYVWMPKWANATDPLAYPGS
ncbi:hypothetical protein ACROYT_G023985 [Oculina patagonica]